MNKYMTTQIREKPYKLRELVCPVCHKTFIPAVYHAYKIMQNKNEKLVCTWSCLVAAKQQNMK